ncbi:metallophosphoesterase, partial [bacterium]|nr:metallophosphoesterase [bacterium]NDA10972.1 metallophosphoesterase [Verrucomicrobiota bacterium]
MRILFLGDVVAEHGREAVRDVVPKLIEEFAPDFIVLNGENVAGGNGITP